MMVRCAFGEPAESHPSARLSPEADRVSAPANDGSTFYQQWAADFCSNESLKTSKFWWKLQLLRTWWGAHLFAECFSLHLISRDSSWFLSGEREQTLAWSLVFGMLLFSSAWTDELSTLARLVAPKICEIENKLNLDFSFVDSSKITKAFKGYFLKVNSTVSFSVSSIASSEDFSCLICLNMSEFGLS